MSVVAYKEPENLISRGTDLTRPHYPRESHQIDPMVYLYSLEREIEMAERRTASMMEDLSRRLDHLENKVSDVSGRFDTANRQLEKAVVDLAKRVNRMESPGDR